MIAAWWFFLRPRQPSEPQEFEYDDMPIVARAVLFAMILPMIIIDKLLYRHAATHAGRQVAVSERDV